VANPPSRRDEQPPSPTAIAAMSDADKLALRDRLQSTSARKDREMYDASSGAQTEQVGLDPARIYAPAVVNIGSIGGVSGLWTVQQPIGLEPFRVVDRPMPDLVRNRMNRLHWLGESGEAAPVGVAFTLAAA
jgi:hypothetical protein